ncbi:hypothetical protein NUW54_g6342 [Trametes sanguinea]|uniref:Uncharacterized protein n=2 Tax=Trametes sanguinea TaxID=158606 RepID=A0ACC1PUE2_9APHY|nr:hypothetical protein NUW54_g7228 [Trametes sanguinea]KAJ3001570.1 hypothetical protein NUW54_g6342 [Trametes sanguinea]
MQKLQFTIGGLTFVGEYWSTVESITGVSIGQGCAGDQPKYSVRFQDGTTFPARPQYCRQVAYVRFHLESLASKHSDGLGLMQREYPAFRH